MAYTRMDRLKKELDAAIRDGDFELALEVVNDMIKQDRNNDQFWNSRGVILSKLDRMDESIQAFDQGLELNPEGSRIWYSKGVVLMDGGKPRAALACFYKSLDCEPVFDKARDRFNRCLDDLVLLKQSIDAGISEEEVTHSGPTMTNRPPRDDEEEGEEGEEEEEELEISEPKARKQRGTYLEEDMFAEEKEEGEEGEEEEEEEEWAEGSVGEWEEEEEEEEEEWEIEQEDDEPRETVSNYIVCRCGSKIPITSNDRPYKFICGDCGRTGTLKT
ncbi:MAG: hypothetical protein JXA22_07275 [Candidatus Thermoplasmatota archaeon]|nr:hypothetical protein [Candidatus Thermoplasmatota archaeon]